MRGKHVRRSLVVAALCGAFAPVTVGNSQTARAADVLPPGCQKFGATDLTHLSSPYTAHASGDARWCEGRVTTPFALAVPRVVSVKAQPANDPAINAAASLTLRWCTGSLGAIPARVELRAVGILYWVDGEATGSFNWPGSPAATYLKSWSQVASLVHADSDGDKTYFPVYIEKSGTTDYTFLVRSALPIDFKTALIESLADGTLHAQVPVSVNGPAPGTQSLSLSFKGLAGGRYRVSFSESQQSGARTTMPITILHAPCDK